MYKKAKYLMVFLSVINSVFCTVSATKTIKQQLQDLRDECGFVEIKLLNNKIAKNSINKKLSSNIYSDDREILKRELIGLETAYKRLSTYRKKIEDQISKLEKTKASFSRKKPKKKVVVSPSQSQKPSKDELEIKKQRRNKKKRSWKAKNKEWLDEENKSKEEDNFDHGEYLNRRKKFIKEIEEAKRFKENNKKLVEPIINNEQPDQEQKVEQKPEVELEKNLEPSNNLNIKLPCKKLSSKKMIISSLSIIFALSAIIGGAYVFGYHPHEKVLGWWSMLCSSLKSLSSTTNKKYFVPFCAMMRSGIWLPTNVTMVPPGMMALKPTIT